MHIEDLEAYEVGQIRPTSGGFEQAARGTSLAIRYSGLHFSPLLPMCRFCVNGFGDEEFSILGGRREPSTMFNTRTARTFCDTRSSASLAVSCTSPSNSASVAILHHY